MISYVYARCSKLFFVIRILKKLLEHLDNFKKPHVCIDYQISLVQGSGGQDGQGFLKLSENPGVYA